MSNDAPTTERPTETEKPETTVVDEKKAALEAARESLVRTGRSQQMPLPHLIMLLDLVDYALETAWTPPVKKDAGGKEAHPTLDNYKMTSEGFPVYTPPPAAPETPPAGATASATTSDNPGSEARRHRTR